MPNWCNNTISIRGPRNKIADLWTQANIKEGLLAALVPQPEDMFHGNLGEAERAECAEKGIPNWYDWNVANWGTKWDVGLEGLSFTELADGEAEISGWFDSAWSPPIEAYQTFCDDMDGVYLDAWYEEGGMDFAGHWSSEGDDDHLDDISSYARRVVENNESGCDLYDQLDSHFDITEARREYIEEELEEENAN